MGQVNLIANTDAKSPVSEAYRTIRTNIEFSKISGKALKVILMTSALPSEGKSTTIGNLAVVMAQAGKKVVLVDCDFRKPTVHKRFKVENKGISNCVASGLSLEEVTVATEVEGMYVIPSGPIAPNPSELLASERMGELVSELAANYDYVLLDAPPIIPVTDAAVLSRKVDGVILLLASGEVSPQIAKEAKTRLEQAGAHILGVVLNKVDIGGNNNKYSYYYYYGNEDGSGSRHRHHRHHSESQE